MVPDEESLKYFLGAVPTKLLKYPSRKKYRKTGETEEEDKHACEENEEKQTMETVQQSLGSSFAGFVYVSWSSS